MRMVTVSPSVPHSVPQSVPQSIPAVRLRDNDAPSRKTWHATDRDNDALSRKTWRATGHASATVLNNSSSFGTVLRQESNTSMSDSCRFLPSAPRAIGRGGPICEAQEPEATRDFENNDVEVKHDEVETPISSFRVSRIPAEDLVRAGTHSADLEEVYDTMLKNKSDLGESIEALRVQHDLRISKLEATLRETMQVATSTASALSALSSQMMHFNDSDSCRTAEHAPQDTVIPWNGAPSASALTPPMSGVTSASSDAFPPEEVQSQKLMQLAAAIVFEQGERKQFAQNLQLMQSDIASLHQKIAITKDHMQARMVTLNQVCIIVSEMASCWSPDSQDSMLVRSELIERLDRIGNDLSDTPRIRQQEINRQVGQVAWNPSDATLTRTPRHSSSCEQLLMNATWKLSQVTAVDKIQGLHTS